MKLVVLGATGGTGIEIVGQAIEHGHSVTASVRSPEKLKPFQDRIAVQQGDLLNCSELEKSSKVMMLFFPGSAQEFHNQSQMRTNSAALRSAERGVVDTARPMRSSCSWRRMACAPVESTH
jgi:putative NADH-flavin reductase